MRQKQELENRKSLLHSLPINQRTNLLLLKIKHLQNPESRLNAIIVVKKATLGKIVQKIKNLFFTNKKDKAIVSEIKNTKHDIDIWIVDSGTTNHITASR